MKKLYRSSTDKFLAGVCGGLAEYFKIDSTIIRLIWVFMACITAFVGVLIAYVLCMMIIPTKSVDFNNPNPDDQ